MISIIQMSVITSFTSLIKPTMAYNCIIKNTLLHDNKMPSIYTSKSFKNEDIHKNNFLTAEHIFPQSLMLNKKEANDMHNIVRTLNTLNVNRSNYRYHEDINVKNCYGGKTSGKAGKAGNGCYINVDKDSHDIDMNNWIELEYGNFVNHKDKLFVPNNDSKGFISRAILYMCREYNYCHKKVIDTEVLKRWFYNYSPSFAEKYHNDVIKRLQNKNNIFISNYNKKNKGIKRILDAL